MLLQSDIPKLARGACEEVAKRGLGACLEAGQVLTAPLSPIALMARGIDVTAFMSAAAIPLLTSFFISLLIVMSLPIHGRWTADHPGIGIQKLHTRPVPRVGGLALVAGAALPLILHMLGWTNNLAPTATDFGRAELPVRAVLEVFVLAGVPAFLFGLAEDLTRRVGVRERLLATLASALLAWWLTGLLIQRLDLAGLDALMSITALSLAFTVVAVSGVSNAINIIDGVHGLASGIGMLALVALGLLAWMLGDETLASVAAILAGATAGFFLLNYPFGRIFLGDSGAYVLGFWVAWMSVMLVARNPDVSPWACLLIVVYPVTEVLYSAQRRFAAKRDPGQPDREHLHSLMKVKWARVRFGKWGPEMQNAAVAPCLLLFASVPMVFAVLFHDARGMLIFASLVFVLVYSLLHRRFMAIPE